jgi:hypothetical protein
MLLPRSAGTHISHSAYLKNQLPRDCLYKYARMQEVLLDK